MTRCTAQNNPHIRRAVTTAAEVAEQQLVELEKLAHDIGVTFGASVHASNYVGRTLEIRRKLRAALRRLSEPVAPVVDGAMVEAFAVKYWGSDWGTAHGCHTAGQMSHERANIRDALTAALTAKEQKP